MSHVPTNFEVETFSGLFVDTQRPKPHTIRLGDIAHALANTCRFGGHCRDFYSVAQHAVFVSKRVERKGHGRKTQLAALHHDDAEAFLGDIPRPLKPLLGPRYRKLTDRMDAAIMEALDLPDQDRYHSVVKSADNFALYVEARFLLKSQGKGWSYGQQGSQDWGIEDIPSRIVVPDYWSGSLSPDEAEQLYLERHNELKGSA